MTSAIQPFPYFNGIEYNSAFFTSIDSGLTIAQANSKYLQKTIPDTATALETFSNGILTDAIDPTTTTGTIQIGQAETNSNVEIAAQASRSTVLHLGDGNLASGAIHIGNGAGSSNNVQILNGNYTSGQTAGQVNILTGTHAVGTIGGNCNIFTGSRGTLTIGNAINNSITVVKQTQFTNGTYSDKMDPIAATSTMTIGGTLIAAGSLTLGGLGSTVIGRPTMSNPINLSYNPSTITTGQIGTAITPTYNTPFSLTANAIKNIATYSLPIGIYYIQANILTPTNVTYQGLGITSTSVTIQYECWSNILTDTYIQFALNVSRVVIITTASTPYYVIAQAGDIRTLANVKTQCFRIA